MFYIIRLFTTISDTFNLMFCIISFIYFLIITENYCFIFKKRLRNQNPEVQKLIVGLKP